MAGLFGQRGVQGDDVAARGEVAEVGAAHVAGRLAHRIVSQDRIPKAAPSAAAAGRYGRSRPRPGWRPEVADSDLGALRPAALAHQRGERAEPLDQVQRHADRAFGHGSGTGTGVITTAMPRAVAAATSTSSTPTPVRATTLSAGACRAAPGRPGRRRGRSRPPRQRARRRPGSGTNRQCPSNTPVTSAGSTGPSATTTGNSAARSPGEQQAITGARTWRREPVPRCARRRPGPRPPWRR